MAQGLVQVADVLSRVRQLIAEPNTNRWTDPYLITFFNDAQTRIASDLIDREAPFPTASTPLTGIPNQQRYPLFPCMRVLRVYLQVPGKSTTILPGTDISTLQGDNLLIYDSSSNNVPGNTLSMSPQWMNQAPQLFPLTGRAGLDGPISTTGPWSDLGINPQNPPQVALDGGYLVLVPPPSNGTFIIIVDNVPIPPDAQQTGDFSLFPQNFRDALAYDIAIRTQLADGRDSQSQIYEQKYAAEIEKIVSWQQRFQGNKPKRFAVIPPRTRLAWDV